MKELYNHWLRIEGFKTTAFFGSMEDVELVGVRDGLEIMVHPEFDKYGNLIDKVDELDGYAVGGPLNPPTGEFILRGYKDL